MTRTRRGATGIAATLALSIASAVIGGVAYGAVAAGGVAKICYDASGSARVIDDAATCRGREALLTFYTKVGTDAAFLQKLGKAADSETLDGLDSSDLRGEVYTATNTSSATSTPPRLWAAPATFASVVVPPGKYLATGILTLFGGQAVAYSCWILATGASGGEDWVDAPAVGHPTEWTSITAIAAFTATAPTTTVELKCGAVGSGLQWKQAELNLISAN